MRQIITAIKVKVRAVSANASFNIETIYSSLALHNFHPYTTGPFINKIDIV
jgi:hypothetical protein